MPRVTPGLSERQTHANSCVWRAVGRKTITCVGVFQTIFFKTRAYESNDFFVVHKGEARMMKCVTPSLRRPPVDGKAITFTITITAT